MERMKENTINYEKVVTKEDVASLTEEEREFAFKEGSYHARYLRNVFTIDVLYEFLASRSRESAYLGHKYRKEKNVTKELIAATITFPNDECFIKILLNKNITYNKLYLYSRAISNLKKITLLSKEFDDDDNIKIVSKKLNSICHFIQNETGIKDFNLILAKINAIVMFRRDLYKKLEGDQSTNDPKQKKL